MSQLDKSTASTPWIERVLKNNSVRCANGDCNHRKHAPTFFRRYIGIGMGKTWFCGPDCFEQSLRSSLASALSAESKTETRQARRMPLGLELVSRGIISSEQLALALRKQAAEQINLGEAAQQLGFVTPEQVTAAVAAQWSCPVFSLAGRRLSMTIQIPQPLLQAFEMLPVHFVEADKRLMIGFVSRVEYQVLSTVERITGCDAVPCFITAPEYRAAMQQLSRTKCENEVIFDRSMDSGEIARMSRNYAVQLAAREVRFGLCHSYFWLRIFNSRQETDLIFRTQRV